MKIAAIIPTYNNENFIEECIKSLLNQTRKFDEIIVVDNFSSDRTAEIARGLGVKVYQVKSNRSEARNIGAKKANADIIAVIESDSVYDEHWVEEVLKGFEEYDCVIDRRAVYAPETFIARMNDAVFDMRFKNYKPFSIWAIRKNLFEDIGGFNENLDAFEDVELGDRLIEEGHRIFFATKAIQYHKGEPKTLREALKRSWWFGLRAKEYYKLRPEKKPKLKIMLFTGLTISILFPLITFLALLSIYIALLIQVLFKGLKTKYALFYPIYSILNAWVNYLGYAYSLSQNNKFGKLIKKFGVGVAER